MNSKNSRQSIISSFFSKKVTIKQEPTCSTESQETVQNVKEEPQVEYLLVLPSPAVVIKTESVIKTELNHGQNPQKSLCHKCKSCPKKFGSYKSLALHMKVHMKGLFECQKCNQKYHTKGSLKNHKCRKMECSVCDKKFLTSAGYKIHVTTFHCKFKIMKKKVQTLNL